MRFSKCDKCKSVNNISDKKKVQIVEITTYTLGGDIKSKSYDLCKKCADDLLKQIGQYIETK